MTELPHTPVAVLGGTGLIGRHVVEALRRAAVGPIVATYHRRAPFDAPDVQWRRADLATQEGALTAVRGARSAVICAGRLSTAAELKRDPIGSITATLRIGVNALEAAALTGVGRVVLLSSIMNYGYRQPGLDQVYLNYLPSYAATAWYHNRLANRPADVATVVAQARAFAVGPYMSALAKGQSISPQERDQIAEQMSRLIGISPDYIKRANLRIVRHAGERPCGHIKAEPARQRGAVSLRRTVAQRIARIGIGKRVGWNVNAERHIFWHALICQWSGHRRRMIDRCWEQIGKIQGAAVRKSERFDHQRSIEATWVEIREMKCSGCSIEHLNVEHVCDTFEGHIGRRDTCPELNGIFFSWAYSIYDGVNAIADIKVIYVIACSPDHEIGASTPVKVIIAAQASEPVIESSPA